VVFFDEIDAIAPRRGGSEDSSHVTERVISQMLTELDGLEDLKGVVVIAATNRPDIIDEALLRPGRFDRMLEVPPPDKEARKQIFIIHTKKKPLDSDVNLEKLVDMTEGMTGAEIAGIANAAAMTAIKDHVAMKGTKLAISMKHFESAFDKVKRKSPRIKV
jgi:transitional endoplasmic reticulum ATPase